MSDPATPILQSHLPILPWMVPALWRLPGIQPLDRENWLEVDDAFAAQLAEKTRLIGARRGDVLRLTEEARPASEELLDHVLAHLAGKPGFNLGASEVTRPDGVAVALDRQDPLRTLGHLVQEDFCPFRAAGCWPRRSADR